MTSEKDRRARRMTAKDVKREETRARLLEVGRRLFADYGYDDVSVTEIGHEAGVTHSMINVYFGGKAGLLYEIVRENNEPQFQETQAIAQRGGDALGRIGDILLAWARGDARNARLLSVMQSYSWVWPRETEDDNRANRARFEDVLARLVSEGQAAGEFEKAIRSDVAATAIWAIYTWGMRASVFEGAAPEDCHRDIMDQVRLVLGLTG